ncbi:hypothetical protein [Comamonas kerstersii]|uniref:hypothetical protein n=1 Tax=Comamonas kerstersii TaxID=225992 RepID=UPI00266D43A0|nr:hypothetical protein [Comamonas kerstersii]
MRPAGEVSQSLLAAVDQLATPERAPTLQEIAAKSGVALDVARQTLKDMKRHGRVFSPRTRKVPYRNRPVAEYARHMPMAAAANEAASGLSVLMSAWG